MSKSRKLQRKTFALVLEWPETSFYVREILAGLHAEASKRDVNILVLGSGFLMPNPNEDSPDVRVYEYLKNYPFDGVLFSMATLKSQGAGRRLFDLVNDLGDLPVVSIGEVMSEKSYVVIENRQSYARLMDHLFDDHLYKRPFYVSGPQYNFDAQERLTVFRQACERFAIHGVDERVYWGRFYFADGELAVRQFWDGKEEKPDVIICANDEMANGVINALLERGVKVPRDVAVTGFDDTPYTDHCPSFLTTIRQPIRELAAQALALLDETEHGKVSFSTKETVEVIRSSCGCVDEQPKIVSDQLYREVYSGMIRQSESTIIDNDLAALERSYKGDPGDEKSAEIIRHLAETMRLERFLIMEWNEPELGTGGLARLLFGVESFQSLPRSVASGSFVEHDLFPPRMKLDRRYTSILEVLSEGSNVFGCYIAEYMPSMSERYDVLRIRLSSILGRNRSTLRLEKMNQALQAASEKLEKLSLSDDMTGHYNRRGFMRLAQRQMAYCRRNRVSFWVLFIDLDGLKQINDNYGHDEGDLAIRTFASIIQNAFRMTDLIARLGGDEFVILASDSEVSTFDLVRKRIRQLVDEANLQANKPWRLDFSMGGSFSQVGDDSSLENLLQGADQKLYEEKRIKKSRFANMESNKS